MLDKIKNIYTEMRMNNGSGSGYGLSNTSTVVVKNPQRKGLIIKPLTNTTAAPGGIKDHLPS
jgi:hypothetical protein